MAQKGWGKPGVSRKFHYFDNSPDSTDKGTSLCRKFGFFFPGDDGLEDDHHDHPENCADCRKRKAKLDAKAAKTAAPESR